MTATVDTAVNIIIAVNYLPKFDMNKRTRKEQSNSDMFARSTFKISVRQASLTRLGDKLVVNLHV